MEKGFVKLIISDINFIKDPKKFYLHVIPFLMNHDNSVVEYHLTDYYLPGYLKNLKDVKNPDGTLFFDIESEESGSDEIMIIKIK